MEGGLSMNRYLRRTVNLDCSDEPNGLTRKIELKYYLVESSAVGNGASSECSIYGIEVVKKENGVEEVGLVKDICLDREEVAGILDKLALNTVTPVSLHSVLEDLVNV